MRKLKKTYTMFQQELLQVKECLLEFGSLTNLNTRSPEVFRFCTTTIIAHLKQSLRSIEEIEASWSSAISFAWNIKYSIFGCPSSAIR